jgi:predicted ATP-grasp superfamily ATP-dependent carboligase
MPSLGDIGSVAVRDGHAPAVRSALSEQPAAGALPPVILLGGGANALAVARSLGRERIAAYSLNYPHEWVRYSRHVRAIALPATASPEQAWARYLTGPESEPLRGAVLLACSDAAIEILARHQGALAGKFRLDDCYPPAQHCMLDKLCTYQAAAAAGVPTPRFWLVRTRADVLRLREDLVFPLLVKPHLSHVYQKRFGRKFPIVADFRSLLTAFDAARAAGIAVMLVEHIPGPDHHTSSYYTYLDEQGEPLYEFTKTVLRRSPAGTGIGCLEVSDWNPTVRDLAQALLRHVGLRGLANVEFKRDQRDGQFKLIECNARFSGATCLLAACGLDVPLLVYGRLVGRSWRVPQAYRRGVRLWYPVEDYLAFRQLRAAGQLGWREWLRSIGGRAVLPYFRWDDPLPSLVKEACRARSWLCRLPARLLGRARRP